MTSRAENDALIDADPERPDGYLVLADLLTEMGDPRGELIVLQHSRGEQTPGARELVLVQQHAPPRLTSSGELVWWCGHVQSVVRCLYARQEDELRDFLDHPSLRFVASLELELIADPSEETKWVVPILAAAPCRASLRRLKIAQVLPIDLEPILPLGLWRLDVTARNIKLGAAGGALLTQLALDGEVDGAELADVVARTPSLRHLVACDLVKGAPFWQELARSSLLEDLWVEGAELDDASVAAIIDARLDRIARPHFPYASDARRAAILRRYPDAELGEPRDPGRYGTVRE
jgi:uncharacterized protein (TIGR02996 family)